MKSRNASLALVTLWLLAGPVLGGPLGPGFTYQGQLKEGGTAANGMYDLTFTLWDALVGGSQVGGPVNALDTPVTDGLFTVQLNVFDEFGPNAFTGDARWLRIDVNGTPLTPRQPLMAAPYALFALDGPGSPGFWAANGTNIYNTNSGSVGIRTNSPQADLHIDGTASSLPGLHVQAPGSATGDVLIGSPAGSPGITAFANNGNRRDMRFSDTGLGLFTRNSASQPIAGNGLFIAESGNVGIGTITPAAKFHSQSDDGTNAVQGIVTNGGRAAYFQNTNSASGLTTVRVDTNSTNTGVAAIAGVNSGDGYAAAFQTGSDTLNIKGNSINSSVSGLFDLLRLNDTSADSLWLCGGGGNVGIGGGDASLPLVPLHVDGGTDAEFDDPTGGYLLIGSAFGANVVIDNNEIMARNNGATSTLYLNNDGGAVRVPVLEITGADLAEKFPVSEPNANIEPGTVMEIDPANPGKLRVASGAYNRRVAGVVSGAGDIPLGAVLGNLPGHEDAPPIALSGRVWVRCDATEHEIEVGDLLTTADTPGHAMKAADHSRAQGAILGKAMTALSDGQGLVLVLVSLQ